MKIEETKDFNGRTPKVGDIIAVIVPTNPKPAALKRARVTSFKECTKMVKMYIEPLNGSMFLYRDYLCLTAENNNQFVIINGECTNTGRVQSEG